MLRKSIKEIPVEYIEKLPEPAPEPERCMSDLIHVVDLYRDARTSLGHIKEVTKQSYDVAYAEHFDPVKKTKIDDTYKVFVDYIESIKSFFRGLESLIESGPESVVAARSRVAFRDKISSIFDDLVNKAVELSNEGVRFGGVVIDNIVSNVNRNENLSRLFKQVIPIPYRSRSGEGCMQLDPLYTDFLRHAHTIDEVLSKYTEQLVVKKLPELAEKWHAKIKTSKIKEKLDEFRTFVRSSYRDYVFWKYADKYISEIKKLDDSDDILFSVQLKELLRKDSSVNDMLYRNLFITLLTKFLGTIDS